jgi:hypothetical protein
MCRIPLGFQKVTQSFQKVTLGQSGQLLVKLGQNGLNQSN